MGLNKIIFKEPHSLVYLCTPNIIHSLYNVFVYVDGDGNLQESEMEC